MPRGSPGVTVLCGARLAIAGTDAVVATRTRSRLERKVLRVLAVRHVVQLALTLAKPTRRVLVAGAAVDALHALSMVGCAAVSPEHRSAAVADAAAAGGLAAAGALVRRGLNPQC